MNAVKMYRQFTRKYFFVGESDTKVDRVTQIDQFSPQAFEIQVLPRLT